MLRAWGCFKRFNKYIKTSLVVDLLVSPELARRRLKEAESMPSALLTDIDVNWLQTVAEGWVTHTRSCMFSVSRILLQHCYLLLSSRQAAPLRGFMREGALLQTLHFDSILVDPFNLTGSKAINEKKTDFLDFKTVPPKRVSMSVPIVLPITGFTKASVEQSNKDAVALRNKYGQVLAILKNPEIYANRKEEIATRLFGVIDKGHPYISHIYSGGDWLMGGEIELLQRIRYNDGLDRFRLTAPEVMKEFEKKNADAVFAFQTRNPTHAGHAYLMKTGQR